MPRKKYSRAGGGGWESNPGPSVCDAEALPLRHPPLATRDCDWMPTKHWSLVGIAFPLELSGKDTSYINLPKTTRQPP